MNSDGVISKTEFITRAEEKFSEMDAEDNGRLTEKGVKSLMGTTKKSGGNRSRKKQTKRKPRKNKAAGSNSSRPYFNLDHDLPDMISMESIMSRIIETVKVSRERSLKNKLTVRNASVFLTGRG